MPAADYEVNHLVDREFRVEDATLVGEQLCDPCSYMESLADTSGTVDALVHRGGLNANILESGTVEAGDSVDW